MSLPLIVVVLVTLVAFATAIGLLWRSRQGRVVQVDAGTIVRVSDVPGLRRLPRGATLLQFSTEVCAPCRATHTVLDAVAAERTDIAHIDLDVTRRPDLASRFNILQTPTTLILDGRGVVRARIGGAPRRADLQAELDRVLVA
ncbi:thiol-disulfide isomerase/thioredoxin [Leifsonia sp. AK011]|uniref:TlpA family protein disulfide reductase n=1 Tax=Leifsonia sp. AK011 TaxID=2723075 RepID=UPI0015CA8A16|nr:thioredoxin family protein [Leifsonia sp. AK011]NYF10479.1 thiol-disulfide isomerase/thioredoxin [Leifsonia sp. AK011]